MTTPQDTAVAGFGRYKSAIFATAAFAVVALAVFALYHLLSEISYDAFIDAVESVTVTQLLLALGFTAGSFAALTVYDLQALRFSGLRLPLRIVALASFCAYSVGNIAGFGPLTGGTIRYRFYAPLGLTPESIAGVVAYVAAAFGIGLAFVGSVGMLLAGPELAGLVGLPIVATRAAALVILALVAMLVVTAAARRQPIVIFGRSIELPAAGEIVSQLLATAVDVCCAAGVLWVLMPAGSISYPALLAVYTVALAAGVLSHLPGGVGVFETVMIGGLGAHVPLDAAIGALVLYRIVYFVVPLTVAALLLAIEETRRATAANPSLARAVSGVVPLMTGTLAIILGAMLVFSGVTPAGDAKLDLMESLFPLPMVEGAHFMGSIIGLFLIVVARGLVHRLDGAWIAAMVLAGLSIPLAMLKGMAIGEAILLAVLIISLAAGRPVFRRPASLLHDRLTPGWWLCIGAVLALAAGVLLFVYKEVPYSHDLWWQFEFSATAPRSLRAALGIGLATAGLAAYWLTRAPTGRVEAPGADDVARAAAIVARQEGAGANLVRMGDKSLMFSDDGETFLMYVKRGRSWIALFDPVGAPANRPELVWRFVELARHHGGRAVFYEVPGESLALYADAGLSAYKLGEEAVVDLSVFDVKGSKRGNLRNAINKAEREGIVFEIVEAADVPAIVDELKAVSDAWLGERNAREKTFSMGAFDTDYVLQQPVAVLKREGRIYAFANVMLGAGGSEAAIDLMRFLPTAPNGTMELLFTRLLLHYKQLGYRHFSLGMAPLSGFSEHPVAPLWHKLGRAAFDHGEAFYNFHGLRAFKAKFDPVWQTRYMAVAGGLNPILALADVTFVIGGGLKGVVSK